MESKAGVKPLPKGWVVRTSKSRHGRSYYFNVVSGMSSWKHPSDSNNKIKVPGVDKKHTLDDHNGSVTSGEMPSKKAKILLSPQSPVSQFSAYSSRAKTSTSNAPATDKESASDADQSGSSKNCTKPLSKDHPKFMCSRTKANHIAKWLDHVETACDKTDGESVTSGSTSTVKGNLESLSSKGIPVSVGKMPGFNKKNKKRNYRGKKSFKDTKKVGSPLKSPKKEDKTEENSKKAGEDSPSHVDKITQSNQVTQSSEGGTSSNTEENQTNKQCTTNRPPLKKVKPRKKTTSTGSISFGSSSSQDKSSPHSPMKSCHFTPFGQLAQQQNDSLVTGTPMNVDRITAHKFSTPFLKSPTKNDPNFQDFFSSPISTVMCNSSFPATNENPGTPSVFANPFLTQPTFAGRPQSHTLVKPCIFDTSHGPNVTSELNLEENVQSLQPDSGFDEVIEMDVDNFEELTETIKAELREVRSDFQVDVQKVRQDKPSGDSSTYEDGLYIILDTNVLLSHLKFISELKDFPIEGVGRPTLIVPWIVMQELDSLKSDSWKIRQGKIVNQGSKDSSIGVDSLARQAIRFLNSCFESKHPRIRGQTVDEANEHVVNRLDESNDDRILHCCILFKRKVSSGASILFSNDQNLCNKAMINGIRAYKHQNLIDGLKEFVQTTQNHSVALQGNYFKEYYEQLSIHEELAEKRAKADDILCELQCILREGLSVVVEAEMRLAYEDLWDTIVFIKPPWTLLDLLQILNKHWIAVFGDVAGRTRQSTVNELQKLLDPQKGVPGSLENVSTIVQLSRKLFDAFALNSSYDGAITKCVAAIAVLQQKCTECKQETRKPQITLHTPMRSMLPQASLPYPEPSTPSSLQIDESTPSGSDETASVTSLSVHGEIDATISHQPHSQILSTFELIWSAVTQFSAQIFNVLSYPNPIPPSVIENLATPTRDEAITFLGRLCRCLGALVTALQSVLRVPVEGLDEEPQTLEKLIAAIVAFQREILSQESQVSVQGLYQFCQDTNSRTALVQGLSQLDRALAMLQHCASCIV